jgi:hypothetical protein
MRPGVRLSSGWPRSGAKWGELAIGKTGGQQIVHRHSIPECRHGGIHQPQCRYPLPLRHPGPLELLQGLFGQDRIRRDGLDFEPTPVGLKPDPGQCGQVVKTLADVEIACVVDGGLGAQGLPFLVILLAARAFVVDVRGRDHAAGNDARAEGSGSGLGDAAVEDELPLLEGAMWRTYSYVPCRDSSRHLHEVKSSASRRHECRRSTLKRAPQRPA